MQDKRIIYTNAEGGVSIIVPAPDATLEQCLAAVPQGVAHQVVDVATIPSDRTFRNAWEKNGAAVATNVTKAKVITHDRRRAKRSAEFAPLDVQSTIPSQAAAAEAARQVIRDKYDAMQTEIDACSTPEQLKAIIDRESL